MPALKKFHLLTIASALLLPLTAFSSPSVQVGFSPEGSARELVLKTINQAHTSIEMIGYSFQAPDIAQALVNAHSHGVNVRVVVDERRNQVKASRNTMQYVASHGVELRIDGHYHIQHDKTIIVDDRTVETGSFNFAPSAETENSENVVVINDMPDVTRQYIAHWQSRWDLGKPYAV
ncbi:phospholipase D family protein [Buttiauxella selenatireducens]|uniref:phospholipase D n=1 Tax=Buttiauxella selenatireducens TaxID=3073902 RepID=A0ABY9S5G6_9ENTR|nr:phospholipase D family protein [Buttiauxella sp. R73]WMY72371.1 phospholipase D family protein [Buttiauxella sp. R73]